LPELAEGSHNITVYGKYNANNIIGLDNRTVYFTINSNPAQENWSEVARFTEDSKFLQKAFTIEHVEWRIRWEYEPDPEISEEHPALYVYVWDKEFPDTYFETILKKGTNETSGTLYIHNRKGTFFLGVIRTVTSFTLIIEQDLTSIPEFPSWTILLLFLIATLTITLIKRRKFIVY
jgi:hypothetical protein